MAAILTGWVHPSNRLQPSLQQALEAMNGDLPTGIPFLVWLLENPNSPIALPGKIDLFGHDCLHLLLNKSFSSEDEAFVVGFTMGNDAQTRWFHLIFFKIFAFLFYPKTYRFHRKHFYDFDAGVVCGRSLKTRNLNQVEIKHHLNQTIDELRSHFGIAASTPLQPSLEMLV